ncbi:MAG: GNAT family N-acetyltransferase [Lachnospiraceae bacterium]|nr:GNAT family N-acetyltransferase [Lachnospiraceae bacterium]
MPMSGINQPDFICVDENLRLKKYEGDCAFALDWYQDEETLLMVDGKYQPYDLDRLYRMYEYLQKRGEVYFIEILCENKKSWVPIGDVSFWQNDMPIVIGKQKFRGRGIGEKVVLALVERAKTLGFSYVEVADIYDYNLPSIRMFEKCGFFPVEKTEKGHRYRRCIQKK